MTEPGQEIEAATRLGRIGFDNVAGYLQGGMQSLAEASNELIEGIDRVTVASLAEQLSSSSPPLVVDVRTPAEWEGRRIDASINLPLSRLVERLKSLPVERPVVVHCTSGYRSAIAASLIQHAGIGSVSDLVGGLDAWEAAELQTEP